MSEQESKHKNSDDENSEDGQSNENKSNETGENDKEQKTSLLEWIAAGIGLVLVVGAIGFMLYQAIISKSAPPEIKITVISVAAVETGYLVIFEAENTGEETASNVAIKGEIKNGNESVEKSDVTLDYVPSHSKRKGGLYFSKNPQQFNLEIRAAAYAQP
ncbi:MAG: TIGR02588 family protein [Pyrinomonadaceae bacterium]